MAKGERRTDTVVLACTHYPLVIDRLERLAPWPVDWVDPAPAIARRVVELTGPAAARAPAGRALAVFSSGRPPGQALEDALSRWGIREIAAAATI
jgi:glutamate racemase